MPFQKRTSNISLREIVYSGPSHIHGTGLFAKRGIGKGEYIGTYHGPDAKRNGTYVLWVYDPDDDAGAIGRSGRICCVISTIKTPVMRNSMALISMPESVSGWMKR